MDKEERIQQRAYQIWYLQGCPHGHHNHHWEQACREIEQEEAHELQTRPNNTNSEESQKS
jgi:hypothetical protein